MKIFTTENTEGFTGDQLATANKMAERAGLPDYDLNDSRQKSEYDKICENILKSVENISFVRIKRMKKIEITRLLGLQHIK